MRLFLWRHPKPKNAQGLCFGQTEIAVDHRKIKRLANQINQYVKSNKLPKVVWVSPLSRCRKVGEQLQQLGFQYHIDERLMETHFGVWENKPWTEIKKEEIDLWCDDFANFAPEGGESLADLFARSTEWLQQCYQHPIETNVLVVTHAGWITTLKMIAKGQGVPNQADKWPRPVRHSELTIIDIST